MDLTQVVMYTMLFVSLYFEVFLLITFLENIKPKKIGSEVRTPNNLPTVAVVVPCFNEETTVSGTLNSLLALDYPSDKLEIIAVNDGSTDGTQEILDGFKHNSQIRIINKENGGKHTAMNVALKCTQSELIGCLDADSYVESDALMLIVTHFSSDKDVSAVTPSIKIHNARSLMQIIQKAEYALAVFIRITFANLNSLYVTPGPFSFFRRSVIEKVGPWKHAHSTEDMEMCMRLQKYHEKITNEPKAIVYTNAPKSLRQLVKQRVRWTYGFMRNAADYYYMFFNPHYGALGILILPLGMISLAGAVFIFITVIWNTIIRAIQEVIRFQTVGVSVPPVQFDPFI